MTSEERLQICGACGQFLGEPFFSKKQWKVKTWRRRCKDCTSNEKSLQSSDPCSSASSTIAVDDTHVVSGKKSLKRTLFSIPPRSTAEIIGRVNAHSIPKKKAVEELVNALKYEIDSEKHRAIVDKIYSNTGQYLDKPPVTYETPGMVQLGSTPLLFGSTHDPFSLVKFPLKEQEISILRDEGMGLSDYKSQWRGGEALALNFAQGECKRSPLVLYLGECYLTKTDVWHFAVQFRRETSTFEWPGHYSVLLCPFCAKLACPPETVGRGDDSYVMICQFIMQKIEDKRKNCTTLPQIAIPRICCKDCFDNNVQPNGFEWGNYPVGATKHNLMNLHYGQKQYPNYILKALPSAFDIVYLFEDSDMCGAASHQLCSTCVVKGFKMKQSRSLTRKNGDQFVMNMKIRSRRKCFGCGVLSDNAAACSACEQTYYCGRDCQRKHWKSHKISCGKNDTTLNEPQPSNKILINKLKAAQKGKDEVSNRCKCCSKNAEDSGGNPAMCFACGDFICCGPCSGCPEMNGINGLPSVLCTICSQCNNSMKGNPSARKAPGILLQNLLDSKPTGRHVNHTRLVLSQLLLNDTYNIVGMNQDVEAAKEEYLWLANDCDYAPAQLALACFYDPNCHKEKIFWDGPLLIHMLNIPVPEIPFKANKMLAKIYYNRACEQKLSIALQAVGTMYKNGDGIYPQDIGKGVEMLQESADLGDLEAMSDVANYFVTSGNHKVGTELFQRAADHGHYQSMFMIAQLGVRNSNLKKNGRKYMEDLIQKDWRPPVAGGESVFMMIASSYRINLDR